MLALEHEEYTLADWAVAEVSANERRMRVVVNIINIKIGERVNFILNTLMPQRSSSLK